MSRRIFLSGLLLCTLVTSNAAPPAWWDTRGATNANPPSDNAMVNQGQLKHFTRRAVDELNARIPGGAGSELNGLIQQWIDGHPDSDDFHAITAGQLKWIAQKIHARLVAIKYETLPPWLPSVPPAVADPADKELVNLGQLKTVFDFDLSVSAGELPHWWQKYFFEGQTDIDPDADADGDGLSNLAEYALGTSPIEIDSDHDGNPDGEDPEPLTPATSVLSAITTIVVLTPLQ